MSKLDGNVGIICPTFEEYRNRYNRENVIPFVPNNRDYSYTVDDILRFFLDQPIQNLVLINPDNPSGNYIPKQDLLRLSRWS